MQTYHHVHVQLWEKVKSEGLQCYEGDTKVWCVFMCVCVRARKGKCCYRNGWRKVGCNISGPDIQYRQVWTYIEVTRVTGQVDAGEDVLTHGHEDLFEDWRDFLFVLSD